MRVIHVTPFYPPHLGGVERAAQALAAGVARTWETEVWTSGRGRSREGAVTVRRCGAATVAHTPLAPALLPRLCTLGRDAIVHVHVAQALWPDVVSVAAAARGFKVVAHFHLDVGRSGPAGFLLPAYKRHVLRWSLCRADRVVALTPSQARFLVSEYGVEPDRVAVIANAADPAFHALPGRARQPGAPLRLLSVGRLDAQKNVGRLIDALAYAREPVDAVIVGDGEQRVALERAVLQRGLTSVRFVGAQRGNALLRWFAWADAFVLSSDQEGMPLALLEAMAAGLAPVVTDVSDLAEIVGEAGLVVAARPASLARAVDQLASDVQLLAELQERSRSRGAAFSWSNSVSQVLDLYDQIAA